MSVTRLLISQELRQEVLLCSVFALLLKKCYLYIFLCDCACITHIFCGGATAGEMMSVAEQFLADQMHPTVIIGAYRQAMDDMLEILRDQISVPVDVENREEMLKIVRSSVGTKFVHHW